VRLTNLRTPCAVIDLGRLERNARSMTERVHRLGASLRPHVKTHKCVEVAAFSTLPYDHSPSALGETKYGPITVSTMAEACHFASHGFSDITWAQPINPHRIEEAFVLMSQVERFNLLVDSHAATDALEAYAQRTGQGYAVYLKVDVGYGRAGVDPHSKMAIELARRLHASPSADFRGVLTHAGHAYACRSREEILEVAAQERDELVGFADRLRACGVEVLEVSLGSTPTMAVADDLTGVTEVRPGNYLFFDRFQALIGACTNQDIAFSVLTTVIGSYPDRKSLVLDAGALALSKDPGASHVDPDCGFGLLSTVDGARLLPDLNLVSLSQEHGQVAVGDSLDPADFPVGTQLRIFPNHSCLTAAKYDRYYALRGELIVGAWRTARGW